MTDRVPAAGLDVLGNGCPALLLTVGEDGFPNTAYTWVVAPDGESIRFAADLGSATLANLEREGRAALQIIASNNLVYLIKGATRQLKPQIEAAPFRMALIGLRVESVKDQSWPGVRVQPLGYTWAPDRRDKMLAMEKAVYAEMRDWNS